MSAPGRRPSSANRAGFLPAPLKAAATRSMIRAAIVAIRKATG